MRKKRLREKRERDMEFRKTVIKKEKNTDIRSKRERERERKTERKKYTEIVRERESKKER
jgi:hypothetical protein